MAVMITARTPAAAKALARKGNRGVGGRARSAEAAVVGRAGERARADAARARKGEVASQLAAAALAVAIGVAAPGAALAEKTSALGAQGCLAGVKCWDGSTVQGCPLGEEGEECRRKSLTADVSSYSTDKKQAATSLNSKKGAIRNESSGEAYAGDLKSIGDSITVYLGLDDFDPARVQATKNVQDACKTWAGKYAPGGKSARPSGTSMNVACNSLLGWTSFNGLAPLDAPTRTSITTNIDKSFGLLEKDQ